MADRELSPTLLSSSAQRNPQMSITLPRNFAPLGLSSGDDPKTPDQTFAELKLPPPPQLSTCRLRRPRITMDNFQARNNALPATLFASDISIPSSAQQESGFSGADFALPSIEVHNQLRRQPYAHGITEPASNDRLKLSALRDSQLPRTPIAQTKGVSTEYKNG